MSTGAKGPCCRPAPAQAFKEEPEANRTTAPPPSWAGTGSHGIEQACIPAGCFAMGDAHGEGYHGDGETPVHEVELPAFLIDATTVTVADFARFVEATGFVTDAQRHGSSAVFHLAVQAKPNDVIGATRTTPWWLEVRGASWRHPAGMQADALATPDHPVTQVSWNDAMAYCLWTGRRLPTEAQWERASRGDLEGERYPWGKHLPLPDGSWPCNIWQGEFPAFNTQDDGFLTTAPARSYEPNGFGLWQTAGNVWEWCADWFSRSYYAASPRTNPQGPTQGRAKVMRGGSYLCHESYCNRYRNAARSSNMPQAATAHCGFRTVALT